MGSLSGLTGTTVYLDANVFVYFLEGYSPLSEVLGRMFAEIDGGRIQAVTSELTLAEVLVKPIRDANTNAIAQYEQILQPRSAFHIAPVSRPVLIEAARLRASTQVKLPDAIHIATASLTGCKIFPTNDQRINVADIQVCLLDQLGG
jgi:predicted nucleic acid-binding protein